MGNRYRTVSEERSPMQREADGRAHKVARAATAYLEKQRVYGGDARSRFALVQAINSYKEIEDRQMKEATL